MWESYVRCLLVHHNHSRGQPGQRSVRSGAAMRPIHGPHKYACVNVCGIFAEFLQNFSQKFGISRTLPNPNFGRFGSSLVSRQRLVGKDSTENKLSNETKITTIRAPVAERHTCEIETFHFPSTRFSELFFFFVVLGGTLYHVSKKTFPGSAYLRFWCDIRVSNC